MTNRHVEEFEQFYYGFSCESITDSIFNVIVTSWEESVQEKFLVNGGTNQGRNAKKVAETALSLLFNMKNGSFKKYMEVFTDFATKYIFRIPPSITLPIHVPNLELEVKVANGMTDYNFKEYEKKLKIIQNRIIEKRAELARLDVALEETRGSARVLTTMMELISNDTQLDTSTPGQLQAN